jgi:hypothetical protein
MCKDRRFVVASTRVSDLRHHAVAIHRPINMPLAMHAAPPPGSDFRGTGRTLGVVLWDKQIIGY